MRIRVDISVFSSPTEAFGNASGDMVVSEVPKVDELFPWPSEWVEKKPTYFSSDQSLVGSVTETEDRPFVMLYGIVCNSIAEARDCADFLEQTGGLSFDEYGHRVSGGEV